MKRRQKEWLLLTIVLGGLSTMLKAQNDQIEFIDLGLPSQTFWANCNVGADSPEDIGCYYAWGETEQKVTYEIESYKYYDMLSASCLNLGNIGGTIYDASSKATDGLLRIPSLNEVRELVEQCTWMWTETNGVCGMKVTGPNGNSIFLPATGYCWGGLCYGEEDFGYYWTDTQRGYFNYDHAWALYFDYSGAHSWNNHFRRYHGHVIRPVLTKSNLYSVNNVQRKTEKE